MPHYEIERHIDATPDAIWPILTDAARLSDGTFGILRIEGTIASGQSIKLWSQIDPKRAFAITVSELVPGDHMVWESGMPMGLFRGARRFSLKPSGDGTVFTMREDYTGALAALMFRMIPDLNPSFTHFADGLERAAAGVEA